jgi:hypothetical protein
MLGLFGPQGPSDALSQFAHCLPVLHRKLYDKSSLIPSPNIACDATGQLITVMIYLYEGCTAAVASTGLVLTSSMKTRLAHYSNPKVS